MQVELNSKLMRDILDVVEGLMRGALNSKGNYDHSSLKLKCSFISENAQRLHMTMNGGQLLKAAHREHAIPLKVVLRNLYSQEQLTPKSLMEFLSLQLVSVLITKDEQRLLDAADTKIKDSMPLDWDGVDVFARFKKAGIKIIERSSSQIAA